MKNQFLLRSLFTGFIVLLFTGSWAQLSIPDVNPVVINFTEFTAAGFTPSPTAGQLNSDEWLVTGCSDNMTPTFGSTLTTLDFANGTSTGGVTGGGIYAFDVGSSNITLGVQPTGADWTPGSFILRIQNNTGDVIGKLDVSYSIFVNNDQARENSFNFSHSSDDVTYIAESSLDYSSPADLDALGWIEVTRSITLTGINIDPSGLYYLRWTGDDVSGSGSRDEFGLDNVSITATLGRIDVSPPVFNTNTPRASDIQLTQFDIVVNLNEIGTVYWLVKNNGDPAPTKSEVRGGSSLDIFTANADFSTTISGLTQGTDYDVYFLAEDKEPVPYVQDTTTLLEVRTQVPRAIDLIVPVGGETFYVGDTAIVRWTSDGIDSLQLWAYDFEELVWHAVLGNEEDKIYAEQDSLVLPIPKSAGLDSTYFRLSDANDFSFFDSCGVFYLIDTIKPVLIGTLPMNHQTNVSQLDTLAIGFDEGVYPNNGLLFVKRKSDDSIFDTVRITMQTINLYWQFVVVKLNHMLELGTEYYVNITPGSFIDYQDNEFAGILDDTTWTFKVKQPVEVSSITELRTGLRDGTLYKLTGEGILTAKFVFSNTKYIQDAAAGIQIYDPAGIITTTYTIGDGITGIIGTLQEYNGMLEFVPKVDPGAATSTGNQITPLEITVAEFRANREIYESRLIKFTKVRFLDAGSTFANGHGYKLVQGNDTTTFYTQYYDLDYKNQVIPELADITALGYEYKGTPEIIARFAADIVEVILSNEKDILAFVLTQQTGNVVINATEHTVDIKVLSGTNVTALEPVITLSEGATVSPLSGEAVDFTTPVVYKVTAENGSEQDWTVTVTIATSIQDNFLSGNVRIWPNPNSGRFNLNVTTGQVADITLQILDVDGRMIFNKEYTSVNTVDEMTETGISEPGVYFVRIMSGSSIWTGKLIIQ
jgi:hypothetical protein